MHGSCALSIEQNESFFSLVNRYCRVIGIPFHEFLSTGIAYDHTALRDFPVAFSSLKKQPHFQFRDDRELVTEHCASMYFGTTLSQPFRSKEIDTSFCKVGTLLRKSIGTSWAHLRYCSRCAQDEFSVTRYSWWHRDHQLPLTNVCIPHGCRLQSIVVKSLGTCLPHELIGPTIGEGEHYPTELELKLARVEKFLASGDRSRYLEELFEHAFLTLRPHSLDRLDLLHAATARIKALLLDLRDAGIKEPFLDWERINVSLYSLLVNGFHYSDPVITILLITALSGLSDS